MERLTTTTPTSRSCSWGRRSSRGAIPSSSARWTSRRPWRRCWGGRRANPWTAGLLPGQSNDRHLKRLAVRRLPRHDLAALARRRFRRCDLAAPAPRGLRRCDLAALAVRLPSRRCSGGRLPAPRRSTATDALARAPQPLAPLRGAVRVVRAFPPPLVGPGGPRPPARGAARALCHPERDRRRRERDA